MSPSPFPYALERAGIIMRPDRDDPNEAEGVLNPAAVVAPDGRVVMYPRVVAAGNRSRIAEADIVVRDGVPVGVERRGILLSADRGWEHGADHGGVEDPRLTWIEALGTYVMTYVAFGPLGPRGGLLTSTDLTSWERLGPVQFAYEDHLDTDLNLFPNKDLLWFPEPVTGPDGTPCLAFLHRPMWQLWMQPAAVPQAERREGDVLVTSTGVSLPAGVRDERASIWISYVRLADAQADVRALLHPFGHRELATPEFDWEAVKIGGGPPPLRVPEGWLLLHHGVSGTISEDPFEHQKDVHYVAGGILLDADDPSHVLNRSTEPLLVPETDEEKLGIVGNVVFPTAIIEVGGTHYVLYGMADEAIGVARLVRTVGSNDG